MKNRIKHKKFLKLRPFRCIGVVFVGGRGSIHQTSLDDEKFADHAGRHQTLTLAGNGLFQLSTKFAAALRQQSRILRFFGERQQNFGRVNGDCRTTVNDQGRESTQQSGVLD